MRKVRYAAFVVATVALLGACVTGPPMSEENAAFQEEAGASLGFALRGLFSLGPSEFEQLADEVLAGTVTFVYDTTASAIVQVVRSSEGETAQTTITVGAFPDQAEGAGRSMYLTGVLAMGARTQAFGATESSEVEVVSAFFEFMDAYRTAYPGQLPEGVAFIDDGLQAFDAGNLDGFASDRTVVEADRVTIQ